MAHHNVLYVDNGKHDHGIRGLGNLRGQLEFQILQNWFPYSIKCMWAARHFIAYFFNMERFPKPGFKMR